MVKSLKIEIFLYEVKLLTHDRLRQLMHCKKKSISFRLNSLYPLKGDMNNINLPLLSYTLCAVKLQFQVTLRLKVILLQNTFIHYKFYDVLLHGNITKMYFATLSMIANCRT